MHLYTLEGAIQNIEFNSLSEDKKRERETHMALKWAVTAIIAILPAVLCIWLVALFIKWLSSLDWTFESAGRRAGRHGEEIAAEIIRQVLRDGDYLLTNIEIAYDGRQAEMDCIVVNRFGVFVFEAKNYSGQLMMGGRVCDSAPSKQPCRQWVCHFRPSGY